MATIQEIIALDVRPASEIISDLKDKSVSVPSWAGRYGLVQEYDPKRHPVMNRAKYPDVVNEDGTVDYVTRWGMKVTLANSGRQALDLLLQHPDNDLDFDLALVDMHMPELDGLSMVEILRRSRRYPQLH